MPELKSFLINKYSSDSVLEISPYLFPFFTGDHVEYFDVLDREAQVERAKKDPNLSWALEERAGIPYYGVPYIHHVNEVGDLSQINKKYGLVFSSHVIEHTMCLITHLNQVYDLLNDDCLYVLNVPDKRYCFDYFIPKSSIASVLEDFYSREGVYSLRTMIQSNLLTTHNDSARHWAGDHGDVRACDMGDFDSFKENVEKYPKDDTTYYHNYQFTPDSFKDIMYYLKKLDYTSFDVHEIMPAGEKWHSPDGQWFQEHNSNEFTVVLKKG